MSDTPLSDTHDRHAPAHRDPSCWREDMAQVLSMMLTLDFSLESLIDRVEGRQ